MKKRTLIRQCIGFFVIAAGLGLIPVLLGNGFSGYRTAMWVSLAVTLGVGTVFWPSFHPAAKRADKIKVGIVRGVGCLWLYGGLLLSAEADYFKDDLVAFGLVLASCLYFLLFTMPRRRKGREENPGLVSVGFRKLDGALFGGYDRRKEAERQVQAETWGPAEPVLTEQERREKDKEEYLRALDALASAELQHLSGLPVTEGCMCTVGIGKDEFLFIRDEKHIYLPMEQVMDVAVKTEEEVRNYYVSDAGGAVAGGMLFGALGASIGGKPQKITEKWIQRFLLITYMEEDETKHICFACTARAAEAQEIVKAWRSLPKQTVDMTL